MPPLDLENQDVFQDVRPDPVPELPGNGGQGLIPHGGQKRPALVLLQSPGLSQVAQDGPGGGQVYLGSQGVAG